MITKHMRYRILICQSPALNVQPNACVSLSKSDHHYGLDIYLERLPVVSIWRLKICNFYGPPCIIWILR